MSNQEKLFALAEVLSKKATELGLTSYRCETKFTNENTKLFEVTATFYQLEEQSEQQNNRSIQ